MCMHLRIDLSCNRAYPPTSHCTCNRQQICFLLMSKHQQATQTGCPTMHSRLLHSVILSWYKGFDGDSTQWYDVASDSVPTQWIWTVSLLLNYALCFVIKHCIVFARVFLGPRFFVLQSSRSFAVFASLPRQHLPQQQLRVQFARGQQRGQGRGVLLPPAPRPEHRIAPGPELV